MPTTVAQSQPDLMMVLMSTVQAATLLFVTYIIYAIKNQDGTDKTDASSTDKKEGSEDKASTPIETRSIRGVNVYGPYKKVRCDNNCDPIYIISCTLNIACSLSPCFVVSEYSDPLV